MLNRNRIRNLPSAVAICVVLALGLTFWIARREYGRRVDLDNRTSTFSGSQSCAGCHQKQFEAWKGSHHEQAMQHATRQSVLGDFNNASFSYNGVVTRFFKRDGNFIVNTDDAHGRLQDFVVKYTFGVYPLQQYLIEFPDGRIQALGVSWDARPKSEGGQHWYHLHPTEKVDHNDELHWTKRSQNWNNMCSECHSTNLKKGFNLAANRFQTTWSEISVGCESCHGPASRHLAWAKKTKGADQLANFGLEHQLDERKGVQWILEPQQNTARRDHIRQTSKEIETCARCHSRRSELVESGNVGKALMDTHLPSLLTAPLFHPDGQIKEEDFEYASFLQSKMHQNGVTCADCHEPHSQKLRAPGNGTCFGCHRAEHYGSENHHHHALNSKGSQCVSCHMPASNFMVIHARHDHSIRVPRPDLSIKLHTPNACNQCHTDQSASWAQKKMLSWYGKGWTENWHFGETLHAFARNAPGVEQDLLALAMAPKSPDIVRATAVSLLPTHIDEMVFVVLPKMLQNKSALVRRAALASVELVPVERKWELCGSLLDDPILGVRMEAARVLADIPRTGRSPAEVVKLEHGLQEYKDVAMASAEHPQSHVNLGLLYAAQSEWIKAEQAYQQAIRLDPEYVFAYVNLADLYSSQHQPEKVEQILKQADVAIPHNGNVKHALGLHYVRQHKIPLALQELAEAVRLLPNDLRFSYVYAVALFDHGDHQKAIGILDSLNVSHPNDGDVLIALVTYHLRLGHQDLARAFAGRMLKNDPRLGSVEQILKMTGK